MKKSRKIIVLISSVIVVLILYFGFTQNQIPTNDNDFDNSGENSQVGDLENSNLIKNYATCETDSINKAKEYFFKNLSDKFNYTSEPIFSIHFIEESRPPNITVLVHLLLENGQYQNLLISIPHCDHVSKVTDWSGKIIFFNEIP